MSLWKAHPQDIQALTMAFWNYRAACDVLLLYFHRFHHVKDCAVAEAHNSVCKFEGLLMSYHFPLCYTFLFSNIHVDNPPTTTKNTNTHATCTKQLLLLMHLWMCTHYCESWFLSIPKYFQIDLRNLNSLFLPEGGCVDESQSQCTSQMECWLGTLICNKEYSCICVSDRKSEAELLL